MRMWLAKKMWVWLVEECGKLIPKLSVEI